MSTKYIKSFDLDGKTRNARCFRFSNRLKINPAEAVSLLSNAQNLHFKISNRTIQKK